jgi:osmotically-inducible protein OsmY
MTISKLTGLITGVRAGSCLTKSGRWIREYKLKIVAQQTFAAALPLLPLLVGCQTLSTESITVQTPIVETPQDEALSKSVRDRLLADKKVDLTGVKVVSSGGTVYLSGEVKSLEARQQAIKLAWEVRGVQSVVNTLEVEK